MSDRSRGYLQCAREACSSPASPRGWNRMTGWMYCEDCAYLLNRLDGLCPLIAVGMPTSQGRRVLDFGTTDVRVRVSQIHMMTDEKGLEIDHPLQAHHILWPRPDTQGGES